MIPVLFPADATSWTTQGLGVLSDAISCTVTEERNGLFELEMQYPSTGIHFSEIKNRCIILAIPSPYRAAQPFRIYRMTKPMVGVCTIYAQHISYDLAGIPLNPFAAASAPAAMNGLETQAETENPFTFWTDVTTVAQFAVTIPSSIRSVLGGKTGSILDVYGGEFAWDGYTVRLYSQRGQDNGVTIAYGKNLTDLTQDENIANVATGIYPYWADTDGNLVTCQPKVVQAPGTYDFTRVVPVDFSQEFKSAPTQEELQARAQQYVRDNKIGVPGVSISVSFVQLEQTEEYKHLALLEKCDLCDTVTVQFDQLGVNAKAEIVRIVADVLLERYQTVEIGSIRASIASTIAGQQQEIQQRPTTTALNQAVNQATNWIRDGKGYMVGIQDAEGNWIELCSLDKKGLENAINVWRWNNGGFGFSSNGYNGPFKVAITQDGKIVADFITTGTLDCALLKVVNLVAQGVELTGQFTAINGDFIAKFWAAAFDILDGTNKRVSIYASPSPGNQGVLQIFGGNWPESETPDSTGRVTTIGAFGMTVGADQDGTPTGSVSADTMSAVNGFYLGAPGSSDYFRPFYPTNGQLGIGNLAQIYINGIGGNVGWKTVQTPSGQATALCLT